MIDKDDSRIKSIRLNTKKMVQRITDTDPDYTYKVVVSVAVKPLTYKGKLIPAIRDLCYYLTGYYEEFDASLAEKMSPIFSMDPTETLKHWSHLQYWNRKPGNYTIAYFQSDQIVIQEVELTPQGWVGAPGRFIIHDGTLSI